jgi:ABC-type Fe3+ transport system substrate-binding protein
MRNFIRLLLIALVIPATGRAGVEAAVMIDNWAIPQEWIDGSKKEGEVVVRGTDRPRQFAKMAKKFNERFPWIKIDFTRVGSSRNRITKTLMEWKTGKIHLDMITNTAGGRLKYRAAKGPLGEGVLIDLRNLPFWNDYDPLFHGPEGRIISRSMRSWCMGYNTEKVKEHELPKTWDELATNARWANRNLALGNRPHLVFLQLWYAKGEEWAKNWLTGLVNRQKIQLRNEGMSSLVGLLVAGEFDAHMPAADYAVRKMVDKCAPVSLHCPEVVPTLPSDMGIINGAPHPNSVKLLFTWWLSKEGQETQYKASFNPPTHPALTGEAYRPMAKAVKGKKIVVLPQAEHEKLLPTVQEFFNKTWLGAGGRE